MIDVQDYAKRFFVDHGMLERYPEYLELQKEVIEKDVLHKAIKQVGDGWICVKPEWVSYPDFEYGMGMSYAFRVNCRAVQEKPIIYIPVFDELEMPKDVYGCEWCGGHTKNDMRGNCLCCGAPRIGER